MPVDAAYLPEPAFAALGPEFSDPVEPAAFPQLTPRFWNARAAATVGLAGLTEAERAEHFGRFAPLPGQPGPRAMRYHGHQFRTYNPDLGDGRGFLAAQLRETQPNGRLLDLGTKGSGRTPWSRGGDGRLTLKGGVREVLAAAFLEAQGVSTSRAFALYETGEALQRGDEPSPTRSAVLTRLSWSHVRFGTFQRLAYFGRADLMAQLIDHVVDLYFPWLRRDEGLEGAKALAPALLMSTAAHVAGTTAGWMVAGFVHGVLNTDNMDVTGESFDYGPWRFLPYSAPDFTAAYFDHSGLYAFGRQPQAVFWNLQQLAAALTIVEPDRDALVEALNSFGEAYSSSLRIRLVTRLGVWGLGVGRMERLTDAAFAALAEVAPHVSWQAFLHDWRGGELAADRALSGPRGGRYAGEAVRAFRDLLPQHASSAAPLEDEPEEMLIEDVEAIWAAIDMRDDWGPFHAKLARLERLGAALRQGGGPGTTPPPDPFSTPT